MVKEKVKINVKERLEDNILDLSLSEIEHVPLKDIAALKRATTLDLSSNNIRFLPKNFGSQLIHLTRLDLSKNELKFLSDDFGNLINLKHLDLYNNHLENLPITFGQLTKLRYLDLKGNPLQPALLKVTGPCLTGKDCQDAAKRVVPFMRDVEQSVKIEQERKQKLEEEQKEIDAQVAREKARLQKKAARKERVMRERQEKVDSSKSENNYETDEAKQVKLNESSHTARGCIKQELSASGFNSFIATFLSVIMLLIVMFVLFLKFLPEQGDKLMHFLPATQQSFLRSVSKTFNKVLNFHKI